MNENLTKLIASAMKSKNESDLRVLRAIKTEFMKYTTAAKDNILNESQEIKILKKMESSLLDSIEQFKKAGRLDLVENETKDLEALKKYLPKELSTEEYLLIGETYVNNFIRENGVISMKDMRSVLSELQKEYSTFPGKLLSDIIKKSM
ncbi:MAG: GatB/YqeY domain-containing protein [Clostridia bacterium]